MKLIVNPINWDLPIVWVNPFKKPVPGIFAARCVSRNMSGDKPIGVMVGEAKLPYISSREKTEDNFYQVDIEGYHKFNGAEWPLKTLFNYEEEETDLVTNDKLGEF